MSLSLLTRSYTATTLPAPLGGTLCRSIYATPYRLIQPRFMPLMLAVYFAEGTALERGALLGLRDPAKDKIT